MVPVKDYMTYKLGALRLKLVGSANQHIEFKDGFRIRIETGAMRSTCRDMRINGASKKYNKG